MQATAPRTPHAWEQSASGSRLAAGPVHETSLLNLSGGGFSLQAVCKGPQRVSPRHAFDGANMGTLHTSFHRVMRCLQMLYRACITPHFTIRVVPHDKRAWGVA